MKVQVFRSSWSESLFQLHQEAFSAVTRYLRPLSWFIFIFVHQKQNMNLCLKYSNDTLTYYTQTNGMYLRCVEKDTHQNCEMNYHFLLNSFFLRKMYIFNFLWKCPFINHTSLHSYIIWGRLLLNLTIMIFGIRAGFFN